MRPQAGVGVYETSSSIQKQGVVGALVTMQLKHPQLPFTIWLLTLASLPLWKPSWNYVCFHPMSQPVYWSRITFICPETSSFKPGDVPWVQSFGICEQTCFHSACTLHDCVSFPSSSLQVCFCSMRPNSFRLCSHKVPSIPVITVRSLWNPCPLAFPHVSATVLSSLTIGLKYHLSNISAQCLPESYVLINT